MDELAEMRKLRADAPTPDRARLVPGRQRLLDSAGHARSIRVKRLHWGYAAAGATAAVTAAALLGTQLVGGGEGERPPAAASQVQPQVPLDDVQAVLEHAAQTVEQQPEPHPRNSQWVYTKDVEGPTSEDPDRWDEQENWYRYADPEFENWKEGDDHSPRERYRLLRDLPEKSSEVLAKARWFYPGGGEGESRAAHDFRALSVLSYSSPMSPKGLAKVYRAMATVEGVEVLDHLVKDAAGRPAIALYLAGSEENPERTELLVDPLTYSHLGSRWVVTRDYTREFPGAPPNGEGEETVRYEAGDVLINSAVLSTALVDEEGQLP